jgi:hypothetical protein
VTSVKKLVVPVTDEEKNLCVISEDYEEFRDKYLGVMPKDIDPFDIALRAQSIWRHKVQYGIAARKHQARNEKGKFTPKRSDSLPDVSVQLCDIHNLIAVVASVQKEQLDLFKNLARRADNPLDKSASVKP